MASIGLLVSVRENGGEPRGRGMRLNALVQDGELQLIGDAGTLAIRPEARIVSTGMR